MTPPALRPLSVGEILDVSFTLYRRHFGALAAVALICSGIPVLLSIYITAAGGMLTHLVLALAYSILLLVLSAVATAATVYIISEGYLGRPIGAREALSRATPLLGAIVVCSILLGLMALGGLLLSFLLAMIVGPGFLLLFVPGVILACGLLLAFPALVLEPGVTPPAALGRAWALARGSRLRMFGLVVTLLILLNIPPFALLGIAAFLLAAFEGANGSTAPGLVAVALAGAVQMLLYPLFYCVLTLAYYDLRVRKEGFDLEVLASTLQPA